jgi:diguanylate cyclase (GGDEF)-like protein
MTADQPVLSDDAVRGYVRRTLHRLSWIRESITTPDALVANDGTLADVVFHLHRLHGSAGSFGFADVSSLVGRLEEEASACLGSGEAPTIEALDRWQAMIADIRRLLVEDKAHVRMRASSIGGSAEKIERRPDVLIVDDDSEIVGLLISRLEREGIRFRCAESIAEGRVALSQRLPDCVITDVNLPDGSGLDIVESLRSTAGGHAALALVISARATFPDRVAAVKHGADGFFEKPIDWNLLVAKVRQVLVREDAGPPRVVLIDDDPEQIVVVRSVLEPAGIDVHACTEPSRVESVLAHVRPDLVLMDLRLPGANGYDLSRFLRQDSRFAAIPIVCLTGDTGPDLRIRSMEAGADDYLTKPVHPGLLVATVSSRIERGRVLRAQLTLDGLTMLLNHRAFMERSRAEFMRLTRTGTAAAMVMLDVDHFKAINDQRGHATGDRVLAGLAALLRRRFRVSDTVGRVGGEEFALVLEGLDVVDAHHLLNKLREEFAAIAHEDEGGAVFHATFSAGFAMFDARMTDAAAWRSAADRALYRAKAAGRNRIEHES